LPLAQHSKIGEKQNHFLGAGEKYDWDEPIIISNNIKPGNYRLSILKPVSEPELSASGFGCNLFGVLENIQLVK
jgi:hypothetical protein